MCSARGCELVLLDRAEYRTNEFGADPGALEREHNVRQQQNRENNQTLLDTQNAKTIGYVLVSSGSNYNFAVGNNTYVTTELEEVVEHLRKTLDEKMSDNIYTRGNYKLKSSPIRVLDALKAIGYHVVSSGGAEGESTQ